MPSRRGRPRPRRPIHSVPSDKIHIRVHHGDTSAVVCAPHGHDYFTAEIVEEICRITGLAGVTVRHLQDPRDADRRVNVNRPTEGAGLEPLDEHPTIEAAEAYADYLAAVVEAGRGSLPLYVEVHGNETQAHVEVATVGLGRERLAIKSTLSALPCGALVEGIDEIVKNGAAAKQHGVFRFVPRGVQIELPESVRESRQGRAMAAHCIAKMLLALLSTKVGPTLARLFRAP